MTTIMHVYMDKKEVGISDLPDQALLTLIGSKDVNQVAANKAFKLFYTRYSQYLWNLCHIVCRHHTDSEELAKEVFQETMMKVYSNASTFDESKGGVKTWLSKVAKNELINLLRKSSGNYYLLDVVADENNLVVYNEFDDKGDDIEPTTIELALNSLSEKERYVLTTYMMYYDEDAPNRHLPDKQLAELSHAIGATPEAIRKIKSRALKKLKQILVEKP